jgi:hypothetical protein
MMSAAVAASATIKPAVVASTKAPVMSTANISVMMTVMRGIAVGAVMMIGRRRIRVDSIENSKPPARITSTPTAATASKTGAHCENRNDGSDRDHRKNRATND